MFDVQFITHFTPTITYVDSARIALEGDVQALCRQYGATFIIDDHVDLVKQLHADGVHLGKQDMPIKEARQLLGTGFLIGGTANTFEDLRQHAANGADYIGCGPFRFTTTKQKLAPILGLDGYRSILAQMKEEGIALPVVGIGGITRDDIPALKALGLGGIALSGSILKAEDPVREMEEIMRLTQ